MSRFSPLSGFFRTNTLAVLSVTAMGVALAACSSSATPEAEDDTSALFHDDAIAPRRGEDTTCSAIVLVNAGLDTPADAASKLSITATVDVNERIDVAKVGLKIAVRAYNLDGGGSYVSSNSALTTQGTWTSLESTDFFTPERMPSSWTKVGPAPAGFKRLTFRVTTLTSALKNEKFDVKDVDYNRLRFDLVPYVIDGAGASFLDRNYDRNYEPNIAKEVPYASISQLSGFGASDATYCCTGRAPSSCVHESFPKK